MSAHNLDSAAVERATRRWVADVVVGLNLCPFARKEMVQDRIRFRISDAMGEEHLLEHLCEELRWLEEFPDTETTLLIHPRVLADFQEYNAFLEVVEGLIVDLKLEGVFQVASFHPDYQFAGTAPGDPENFTNRSPYPMLHLLREASVERAVDAYPDTDSIPERNIRLMNEMGSPRLSEQLAACIKGSH